MSKQILIVGRGAAGQTLAEDAMRRGSVVVGFLDDRVEGVDVLGTLSDINDVIERYDVEQVYFAIPSVDAGTVRDFINTIESDRVEIAIIPRTYGTISKETVDIGDLTDIDVLDLVGRQPVKHNLVSAREFMAGKRVLVTGAAGSIGSRLVKQIAEMSPSQVVCVDWWENGMFFLRQDLLGHDNFVYRIADIKNRPLMDQLFAAHRPDIVFHAAAYKHVPLMQDNPSEAVNNNVGGSLTLMQLAIKHAVENFVYVSTDKAVNPVNVMGATKRLGEMLMESLAQKTLATKFSAVRFGNVIQSNGSVMQIFRDQIAKKQPLTVTHPDVTRFFMTIDEASQLIIQSALIGKHCEIFVLDMGEPVRILDLAKSLVRAVNPALPIRIVGLRPGEKMYEELSYEPSKVDRTSNGSIFIARDAQNFDTEEFLAEIEVLLAKTAGYSISNEELIQALRNMDFAIQ
jgi:FlaA1/EpsC-like NDP-sugar epimerase